MSKKQKHTKNNKYADLSLAEDEFDFHGLGPLTPHEIEELAYNFLWKSYQNHLYKVRIITGKGLHSSEGPIIKPTLQQYLPSLPFVKQVTTAKYNEGGTGALDIIFEPKE